MDYELRLLHLGNINIIVISLTSLSFLRLKRRPSIKRMKQISWQEKYLKNCDSTKLLVSRMMIDCSRNAGAERRAVEDVVATISGGNNEWAMGVTNSTVHFQMLFWPKCSRISCGNMGHNTNVEKWKQDQGRHISRDVGNVPLLQH